MEQAQPARRTVMIREVDVETWVVLKAEAARRRWSTAAVLEHIVAEWLADRANAKSSAVA